MDTLSGEASFTELFWLPIRKGNLFKKGKKSLQVGANSFLLEKTAFQKGNVEQEKKS